MLAQAVMQLAGDAFAFRLLGSNDLLREGLPQCLFSFKVNRTYLPGKKEEAHSQPCRQQLEPECLIKARQDGDRELLAHSIPDAVTVCCQDRELKRTRRQVGK